MRTCTVSLLLFILTTLAVPGRAAEVSVDHDATPLLGNLETVSANGLSDGVVLIVHGTLAHHGMEIVATLQELLAERGRNSLAITLSLALPSRRGMYDCATPHRHRHQDAVAEVGRWLDWLATRDAGPVTLVGHSRGGNQVARAALAYPARVHRLVLIAPGTLDMERARTSYRDRHDTALDAVLDRARSLAPETWLDDVGFLYCEKTRVTAGAFASYHAEDGLHDTYALLSRIRVPTVVVAGSEDRVVAGVGARTAPHLDADTRLVVIDGADHFFRDLFAEDLVDAVESVLESPGS